MSEGLSGSKQKKRGNGVRSHSNEGQGGLPRVTVFPRGKRKQEKGTVSIALKPER